MNFLTPEITITPVNPTPSDYEDNDGQEEYDENPPNYASMLEQQYDENPPNYASMLEQVMFEQGVMPDPTKEVSFTISLEHCNNSPPPPPSLPYALL